MRIPKSTLPGVATYLPVGYHAGPAPYWGLGVRDWGLGVRGLFHNTQSPSLIARCKRPRKHKTMFKRIAAIPLICLFALALLPAPAAHAAPRCFPEAAPAISACIDGPIADFWARNGGLPVFGYPIGTQQPQRVEGR